MLPPAFLARGLRLLWVLVCLAPALAWAQGVSRKAEFTIRVFDEFGEPVPGAYVRVQDTYQRNLHEAVTNSKGFCAVSMNVFQSHLIAFYAKKEGFYLMLGAYRFIPPEPEDTILQPVNPTIDLVLKHVRNPRPLYAKKAYMRLPAENESFGFDLLVGDWVAPYGEGKVKDFVVEAKSSFESFDRHSILSEITFPNPGDGLLYHAATVQATNAKLYFDFFSDLPLPHEAPEEGYMREGPWQFVRIHGKPPEEYDPDVFDSQDPEKTNYFFRIRTEMDPEGNVVRALYGKIYGPIEFNFVTRKMEGVGIVFLYYLNPDWNDRNLEFDPEQNLFEGLKDHESPQYP